MKRYILFTIYCLLFTVLAAQGLSEQKIIEKMASAAEKIKTVECNFTQTKQSKMLSKPQMSEGKMFCQQPDKLRWEYTSPRASTLVLEGTEARLLKGNEQEARNKFIGEMARMIMNCVAGKNLTDNKTFQVSAKEMPTEYVATLVPQRKDMKRLYTKLVLHYNLKQETVTEIELHEKNGDRTLIELHDISINGK
ncbi:MAG: outer membrane lipoprotein carrier protein LolA [Bacteroidaceae bacterium]|nr:outer membrane lipoprotein carrier protein LolA [Bacteroidaceae bacterium]